MKNLLVIRITIMLTLISNNIVQADYLNIYSHRQP